ncbi:MAG TPA: hypothetical protein VFL41_11410 [Gaiellaceae bacterium]|nr:hypothetical protein [Gaiellaceae bacterium]
MPSQQPPDLEPERIFATLDRHGVEFVVIGAVAAIAQGYPLNTSDLDVTPARHPVNLERLAAALTELEARLRVPNNRDGVEFPIEPNYLGRAESWTLTTRYGPLDVLFQPTGTRGYDDLRRGAVGFDIAGTPTRMASLVDLIRMKEASARPKDLAQLPALRQTLEIARERERPDQS